MSNNIPANNTLRPGLLVAVSTSITGNVSYVRKDLETGRVIPQNSKEHFARWETERTITDKVEHEAAQTARNKARLAVSKVCYQTAFGLMALEADAPDLEAAIAEANKIVADFNADAKLSRLRFFAVTGRVAQDDVTAVKAISTEVRDLLDDMKSGLENLDAKTARDAATKLKQVGNMLSEQAQVRIELAIKDVRAMASKIAKAGTQAATEIDRATLRRITETRAAFLDIDMAGEIRTPVPVGRAVDLVPEDEVA